VSEPLDTATGTDARLPLATSPLRAFVRVLLIATAVSTIVVASVRLTLPGVSHYRDEVAEWLGSSLGQRVMIGSLEAGWRGWVPELWVNDVRLVESSADPEAGRTLARFEQATITIDPLATLRRMTLVPGELIVRGASLAVTRDASGRLRLEGLPSTDGAADAEGLDIARLLLGHTHVRLLSTDIVWRLGAATAAPAVVLRDVSLDARHEGGRQRLDLSLSLPGERAGTIGISADIDGDILGSDWRGSVTATADDVDLAKVPGLQALLRSEALSGRARLQLRSMWRAGRVERAEARAELAHVRLGQSRYIGIPVASARGSAQRVGDGWRIEVDDVAVTTSSGVWPRTTFGLDYAPASDAAPGRVAAQVGYLRVQDAVTLAAGFLATAGPPWPAALEAELRGELRGAELALEQGASGLRVQRVSGEFLDLTSRQPIGSLPAVENAAGSLAFDADGGTLSLWRAALRGSAGGALEQPVAFDQVQGSARWSTDDTGTQLELSGLQIANDDLSARGDGRLTFAPGTTLPVVDATIDIERAEIGSMNRYLPHPAMRRPLSRWLHRALQGGTLSEGEIRVQGDLGRLPAALDEGIIEARGRIEGGQLDYAPNWPQLGALAGELRFTGKAIQFDVTHGEIYDSVVSRARVDIADVTRRPVVVEVDGRVDGTTEDAARYLRQSPLGSKFRHLLDSVTASGKSSLDLDLSIPARKGTRKRVRGTLAVHNNLVDLPGLTEGLQAVSGAFAFSGRQVTAKGVEARYLGRPISLSAGKLEGSRATRLRVHGRADATYLARHLHNSGLVPDPDPDAWVLTSHLDGETTWTAVIDVPHVVGRGATRARIAVESSMAGVSSNLPHPFDKAADDHAGFVVQTQFEANGDRLMRLEYGGKQGASTARALLLLKPGLGRHRLHSGALRLGGGEPSLPQAPGIEVDGKLERLSVADWLQFATTRSAGRTRSRGSLLDEVRKADLDVQRLEVAGLNFEQAAMRGARTDGGGWQIAVEGPHASGTVSLPRTVLEDGIDAEFEHMVFRPDEEARRAADPEAVDPRKLPPVRFTCRSCRYKDQALGVIEVETSPIDTGLRIDSLRVQMPHATISSNGTWVVEPTGQRSHLDARGRTADLGAMVGAYTEDPPTSGGELEVQLNASWPGSPGAFELSRVEGVLQMRARDGRLMNIDPGAGGRLFQLLSVTSLPRRLRLDFSDLKEEGFHYKEARGTFTIADGNAFTEDFFIDSEMARIDIRGRTGLSAEDYDQTVTITPRLTSSLPLAPIWLAEKVLNAQIFDRVFAQPYHITGSWEDPVVEKIIVPGVEVEGD
jgi:uncharacterized protein (TIGR02099 family)